jgi:4'-phosphopantetheinyl transferase
MKPEEVCWLTAPGKIKRAAGVVHVFSAPLDLPLKRLEQLIQLLSDDELNRAQRFRLDRDSERFIAGRGTLREILGALLGIDPKLLVISPGEYGKPRLAAPAAAKSLHFNLAHADSFAVIATGEHELGVDLERVCALGEAELIASRFFSTRESDALLALPVENRQTAFFNCWTRKEAYLKAIGTGLAGGLDPFESSLEPGGAVHRPGFPNDARQWSLHSLHPAAGFVGALAVQPVDAQIHCWSWNPLA